MWQRAYLYRLKRDIDLWIERGWVTPANAEAILKQAEEKPSARRMPAILAILGAVLIGFAVMSFVAANWNEISKLAKLVMIFAALWLSWGAAFILERRAHPAFTQAAVLIGLGIFGGGIMLIAQIYHIVTDDPGGVLAWCIASLAAAWLLPSRPALALGILLMLVWTSFTLGISEKTPHWAFWIPWIAAFALSLRLSWLPGFHLALLAAFVWQAIWAVSIAETFLMDPAWLLLFYVFEALAIWLAAMLFSARSPRFASTAEAYAIFLTFALFWIWQISPDRGVGEAAALFWPFLIAILAAVAVLAVLAVTRGILAMRDALAIAAIALASLVYPAVDSAAPALVPWVYAALFLALSAWLVSYGTAHDFRFAVNFGFVAFGAEVLWLYFETMGTLLDTAIFFALGGILLIAGSVVMERMRRRLVAQVEGDAA